MAALAACTLLLPARAYTAEYQGVIRRVIDGDTIVVRLEDGDVRVRLIGIDCPESRRCPKFYEDLEFDCRHGPDELLRLGREASAMTGRLLPEGSRVRLVTDEEPADRYGRMLAYVYEGGKMVNCRLVEAGYARAEPVPPNLRHARVFYSLMRKARRMRVGIWE